MAYKEKIEAITKEQNEAITKNIERWNEASENALHEYKKSLDEWNNTAQNSIKSLTSATQIELVKMTETTIKDASNSIIKRSLSDRLFDLFIGAIITALIFAIAIIANNWS